MSKKIIRILGEQHFVQEMGSWNCQCQAKPAADRGPSWEFNNFEDVLGEIQEQDEPTERRTSRLVP